MKICKRQYRIVTDNFSGFEVQKRLWYYPFWFQIRSENRLPVNTHKTIESAEKLIEMDKTNSRPPKSKVVKTFNCE
ncbi:MAG: hypothetical protein CMO82_11080 [Winogradskyella sp.]|nr:hypothetical protein [Winogradskyella sp.]|tara:strand:- start:40 stop:267 length:228 start_codon:yes stop_codon:yes gene_type:complete